MSDGRRLSPLRATQVIRALEKDGWYQVKGKGGHRDLKHPTKPGRVTVPVHGSRDMPRWVVASIVAQAGLTVEQFLALL